jgi:hypothetical protein
MSRGTVLFRGALGALVVVALVAAGARFLRRRAHLDSAAGVAKYDAATDPTWCGKPLGAGAIGQLKDPTTCTKISLTGTAPACFFWADCGEIHFQIDCTAGGALCRCDGEDGRDVPYNASFCALDDEKAGASLRAVLDSASKACKWAPASR